MLSEIESKILNKRRENEFTIGINYSQESGMTFKTVKVIVEVIEPNKYGVFKIITQIGDEEPTERIATINNNKIVKTT